MLKKLKIYERIAATRQETGMAKGQAFGIPALLVPQQVYQKNLKCLIPLFALLQRAIQINVCFLNETTQ